MHVIRKKKKKTDKERNQEISIPSNDKIIIVENFYAILVGR